MTPRRLIEHLDAIDLRRQGLIGELRDVEPDMLAWKPAPETWSRLEILEHLVLAEEVVLGDFSRLDELPARTRALRHRMGYALVMFVLRFGIPVRAPSRGMVPTGRRSFEDLVTAWDSNHAYLRAFVGDLDRAGAARAIFRHPASGPMTVDQGIRMLGVHLDTHIRQIRRVDRMAHDPARR